MTFVIYDNVVSIFSDYKKIIRSQIKYMKNMTNTKKTKPFIPPNFLHTQYLHFTVQLSSAFCAQV